MTRAAEDLLQAVYGLRKAAEAQFTGNAYYRVANEIDALIECLGWGDGSIPVGKDAAYGFSTMLAEVGELAKARTSGNQYFAIVCKLDRLASYLTPSAEAAAPAGAQPAAAAAPVAPPPGCPAHVPSAAAPAAAPVAPPPGCPAHTPSAEAPAAAPEAAPASFPAHTPSAANPSFADLAAASKSRVEDVAASLGLAPAHHAAPSHREAEAAPAAEVLETRSSEPCAMAELAPVTVEPVAAAAPLPADHAHHAVADGAPKGECPFHALFAEPAGEAPAEPAPAEAAPAEAAPADAVEAPGERRLESRSSDAVSQAFESVEPAAVPGQAAPEPAAAEAAPDLGSPAVESEVLAVEEITVVEVATVEIAVEPAVTASAPSPEPAAPAAVQKIEVITPAETKRKEPKTLFKLWLDLAFGRKD